MLAQVVELQDKIKFLEKNGKVMEKIVTRTVPDTKLKDKFDEVFRIVV